MENHTYLSPSPNLMDALRRGASPAGIASAIQRDRAADPIPAIGDAHTFHTHTGYRLVQNRPWDCRPACTCGACNGTTTTSVQTVTEVIRWADNSVEVIGDRGGRATLIAAHGDVCY